MTIVELVVHPRDTVSFEEFCGTPAPAVALDGYVFGPSRWTKDGHFSFNHHDGSDRFTTRSTCEQVALALRARAPITDIGVSVHVNDDDPDVALSVWLLEHPELATASAATILCGLQGAIDTCGGACGNTSVADLDALAWVIDPWARTRNDHTRDADEMRAVIEQVGARISEFADGRGRNLSGDWAFDIIDQRARTWAVVEHHPLARARVCTDGPEMYVAVRETRDSSRRDVTVGKSSPFVDCDLEAVWASLNQIERCEGLERWGGGDMIGGSPRTGGTTVDVTTIVDIVEAHLA